MHPRIFWAIWLHIQIQQLFKPAAKELSKSFVGSA